MSLPVAQLGEDLLHLSEDVAEHGGLLESHPIWTQAEAEPPGTVERVLLVPSESVVGESILLLIVVIIIMSHSVKEGVPKKQIP